MDFIWVKVPERRSVSLCDLDFLVHTAALLSLYLSYVPASNSRRHLGWSKNAIFLDTAFLSATERRDSRDAPLFCFPKKVAILY
jgi:hypothetical protein